MATYARECGASAAVARMPVTPRLERRINSGPVCAPVGPAIDPEIAPL